MNYEGSVSSVNTTLWTFELDNKITAHMGHLAAHSLEQMLPEIGEKVQIYNAHFKASNFYGLDTLFLCEKSKIICNSYKTYTREDAILKLIQDYNLGVSDLLEILYNITIVSDFMKSLIQESPEEIMFEIVRCIAPGNNTTHYNEEHTCLNKIITAFTLKTISSCHYIDTELAEEIKGPPWSFGTHSKTLQSDILIGHLQINKRFGIICMYDAKHTMPCLITTRNKTLNKNSVLNRIVLVKEYRIFTESYREATVPNSEYLLFDIEDVIVLDLNPLNQSTQDIFVKEFSGSNFPYMYDFEFTLCKRASVNVVQDSMIECWLEVLLRKNSHTYFGYLALNAYQVRVIPFLQEGRTYHVYHNEKLKNWNNFELLRIKSHSVSQKFTEKTAIFVEDTTKDCDYEFVNPILNITQAIAKIKESSNCISFQGLLSVKKFTPALSSRTQKHKKCVGFGTPGSHTHTLIFVDDTGENTILLYLNNWENLQIPLGLILNMRICVRNVLPQKSKYLKCSAITSFEVLGYEPRVLFDTVNLSSDTAHGCDKYTFLGLGDLIPCNVLIWARISQLHFRSLKIITKCDICNNNSTECSCKETEKCTLEITMTLYVYDEMGQAMIISKSLELFRLLLNLEVSQWKVWCKAFESIGEYIHDFEQITMFSNESDKNAFCEALALSVKVLNAVKISKLDLMCRKMESSAEDNDGMPKWFCVDARKREED